MPSNDITEFFSFIDNVYKLFSVDPSEFKSNMHEIYNVDWNGNHLVLNNNSQFEVTYYEDESKIIVEIILNSEVIGKWERKKQQLMEPS